MCYVIRLFRFVSTVPLKLFIRTDSLFCLFGMFWTGPQPGNRGPNRASAPKVRGKSGRAVNVPSMVGQDLWTTAPSGPPLSGRFVRSSTAATLRTHRSRPYAGYCAVTTSRRHARSAHLTDSARACASDLPDTNRPPPYARTSNDTPPVRNPRHPPPPCGTRRNQSAVGLPNGHHLAGAWGSGPSNGHHAACR